MRGRRGGERLGARAGAALLLIAALLPAAQATAQDTARPQSAGTVPLLTAPRDSYRLEATLDPEHDVVHGRLRVQWTNRSRVPLSALFFHLYANAFASKKTLFMREQGEHVRNLDLDRAGGIDVLSLRAPDGSDWLARAHTDLHPEDATQMRVDLPAPLAPGEAIALELRFRVRLPTIVARMGATRDFFMIAQWFPKLAKLEPDGRWASFPYHGLGEFYADFADYDLNVRVPADYVVAAPGEPQARALQPDGTRVEHYVLPRALDIAWAAYPRFARTSTRAGALRVDVFAPRGHATLARALAEQVGADVTRLSARLGVYPQQRLVLVVPPAAGHGAAGMEYPGLIVGWPLAAWSELNPITALAQASVTAHELAHQWFAMLLANDEVQTPVLDEGFAEWLALDLTRERYGRSFWQRAVGLPIDGFELERAMFARSDAPPTSLAPAYRYRADTLGLAVYARPALALETIRRTWGAARFEATLGAYARAHRFGHPTLSDLWAAFDQGYWPGFSRQVLQPALEGKPFDTRFARARPTDPLRALRGTASASALPERVEITRRSPPASQLRWPADAPELVMEPTGAHGAGIDPGRHNLLDRSRGDDQLRLDAGAPSPPLLARLLLWAQLLLAWVGP
jgi:hypothetical protein